MKQSDKDMILKIGIAAGAYFLVLRPILQKLGIAKTAADQTVEAQQTLPNDQNPFSPVFWKRGGASTMLLKVSEARALAKQIYDAMGYFSDNEAGVFSAFRKLKTQSQVSFLAEQFQQVYKIDLLQYLSKGKGVLPQAGLNNTELNQIISIVNNLPKYKI